jgi:hypothetical protein
MIAFLCASFLLLVVALQRPRPGWGLWLGYVAVTTAAVYMGLEAVLAVPAQLAMLLWHRRHAKWLLSALLVAGLCCIPLAVLAVSRGSSQIFWIPLPNAFTTKQVLLTLSSAGLEPQFYTSTSEVLRWLTEVLVILAGCAVLWQLLRPGTRRGAWKLVLIAVWLLGPPILAWVISELGHSMFEARYLLMALPAVAVLLAWLVVGLAEGRPALGSRAGSRATIIGLRVLALGLLGALFVLRALQLAPSYGVSTEPWRAVTRHVVASSRPGDCIAFYPLDSRMPFRYYLPAGAQPPHPILPDLSWGRTVPFVEAYATLSPAQLGRVGSRCGRVWLVSGHEGHNSGTALARAHYQRFQRLVVGLQLHYLHTHVRTYGAAHIITLELLSNPVPRPSGRALF